MIDLTQFDGLFSPNDTRLPWRTVLIDGLWEVRTARDERPGSMNNYQVAGSIQDGREAELFAAAPQLLAEVRALRERVQELEGALKETRERHASERIAELEQARAALGGAS
jgi:hypothetical protein